MENSVPEPPAHLSDEAAMFWRKIVDEWQLDAPALLILQTACEAHDRMRDAQRLIVEHGQLTPDRFGQLKTNPAVLIERDSRSAMLAAIKQLHFDLEPLHDKPGRPAGS